MADITDVNIGSAAVLAKCCEVRHSGPRFVELVISNGKEALGTVYDPSTLNDEEASTKEGFYSSSDSYLRIARTVFMEMWKNGTPLDDRLVELKTARWEKLVGDPDGALRAFARGQRVIGANSNVVAQDSTLGLTPTGCKIGQLVEETPHLCDL